MSQMVFVRVMSCSLSYLQCSFEWYIGQVAASGVGCNWHWIFAGVFSYADDIFLLAPSASAIRNMLSICSSYATSHGLFLNDEKTQLICFRKMYFILQLISYILMTFG